MSSLFLHPLFASAAFFFFAAVCSSWGGGRCSRGAFCGVGGAHRRTVCAFVATWLSALYCVFFECAAPWSSCLSWVATAHSYIFVLPSIDLFLPGHKLSFFFDDHALTN